MLRAAIKNRLLIALTLAAIAIGAVALHGASSWYERPFAGILLDPDGVVSSFGLPTWDGFQQGLRYPDQVIAIDGEDLSRAPGSPGAVWNRAVDRAAAAGRGAVHARVRTSSGERELDLRISPFDPAAFWLDGFGLIGIGALYVGAALLALGASPKGRLARTFAKTSLLTALFLFTVFDYHTTRTLVPLFHVAFALVPMGFLILPLRLPDDAPALRRWPWAASALDAAGGALALVLIGAHFTGVSTLAVRGLCSALFALSFLFFAVTFLIRFARATGDRRIILRALLVSMVPAHVVIGMAFVLASLSLWGATNALLAVPALALTPLASVVAFIRHDLWGSRALLSRVLVRAVVVAAVAALAVALGTALAALFHVPVREALLAATVAGFLASVFVGPALRLGDRALFPSRGVYKPSIAELSEELTLLNDPEQVGHAVVRTVRRWLPCDTVEFVPTSELGEQAKEPPAVTDVSGVYTRGTRVPLASQPSSRGSLPSVPEAGDELALDVLFHGRPLAVLKVGKKRGGALFTSEDIDLLRTIGNQAALALAHAYSYAELELRRKQEAAAWRGEREALVETVAAEIAHEVRYPINYFRSIFQRGKGGHELDAEEVDIGCDEVERLERLVSGLRRVSTHRLERRPVAVAELAQKAERLLRDQLGSRRLLVDIEGTPLLRCDFDQATQVLVNLLSNALDAAGQGGQVGLAWDRTATGATLSVWDSGPGFDGDPARVFAPWYTTKPRGTGLGLSISHRIVRAHGWSIDPARRDGRTVFAIAIPHGDLVSERAGAEVA